jgi:hypothetical protein
VASLEIEKQTTGANITYTLLATSGGSHVNYSIDKKGITDMLGLVNKYLAQPAKADETISLHDGAGNSCVFHIHAGQKGFDIQFSDRNNIFIISMPLKEVESPELKQLLQAALK